MTKKEFLDDLNKRLKRLPEQERSDAIKFYEEYFDEAGAENEQKVIAELRSPAHIASKILFEYAEKEASSVKVFKKKEDRKSDSAKDGVKAVWFTILGIFAAPIAIPLAIAFAIVVVALSIGLVALIFGLIIGSCVLVLKAFILLFVDPASALLLVGLMLLAIGITRALYDVVKWVIQSISKFVRK